MSCYVRFFSFFASCMESKCEYECVLKVQYATFLVENIQKTKWAKNKPFVSLIMQVTQPLYKVFSFSTI